MSSYISVNTRMVRPVPLTSEIRPMQPCQASEEPLYMDVTFDDDDDDEVTIEMSAAERRRLVDQAFGEGFCDRLCDGE